MSANPKDFAWMWQGSIKKKFTPDDAHYLNPIMLKQKPGKHAILLIHGFSSTPAVFRTLLSALTEYNAVMIPVLPGHAHSIEQFSQVKATDWITHVEHACESLLRQYEYVDVLGLSLGGILAHHLAKKYAIHRLFLLAPAFFLRFPFNLGPAPAKCLHKLGLSSLQNQGGNIHGTTYHELTYRRLPLPAIMTILDFVYHYELTPVSCPTELFMGKHDAVVNVAKTLDWFKNQSNTNIHLLKQTAHVLPLDADHQHIGEVIKKHALAGAL